MLKAVDVDTKAEDSRRSGNERSDRGDLSMWLEGDFWREKTSGTKYEPRHTQSAHTHDSTTLRPTIVVDSMILTMLL